MHSILVVDDCSIDRRLVRGLLCCGGDWNIRFAEDGAEALEAVALSPPDLIITDLQMPRVDGLQLVRLLKKQHPEIPVVLIASQASHDIALCALREGAAYYSPKSALGRDLLPVVQQVLGISEHLHSAAHHESAPPQCAVSFELENDDCLIYGLIEHLQVNLPEWADADRIQIAMALHEAVTNAMHHGNLEVSSALRDECENKYYETIQSRRAADPFCHRRVRIEATYHADEVTFRVIDQGPGFDPAEVGDPRATDNLDRLSGRGLLLIRSFMDDVRHNAAGNQITMIKRNRAGCASPCNPEL